MSAIGGPGTVVVFDLDDTLYKERDYVFSGRRAVARHAASVSGLDADRLMKAMKPFGPTDHGAFDALIAATGPAHADMRKILERYRMHKPEISLDPSAEALLAQLKCEGTHLALITDGRAQTQRLKIEALGLGRFIEPDAVFISEETGGDKTSPLPFEAVESRFPGLCRRIYIGDNPAKDFRHPRMRGWSTVMLADPRKLNIHPQNLSSVPPENRPDCVIFGFQALTSTKVFRQ